MSQFFIGIDLGTTHSALFYAESGQPELKQFSIPQLTAPGQLSERPLLPSFIYHPHESEFLESDLQLPWGRQGWVTGQLARELGAKSAGRLVQSAKSWLCHSKVSADEAVLPVDAVAEVSKLSSAEVTQRLLSYLISAWNHAFPEAPMADQNVVITVPASFDPAARSVTESAAQTAGLNARLIEEPLAAFYAWLADAGDWRKSLALGDQVLVVDVGGGTTDLSLIQVAEEEGNLQLERIAVGRHILLGGDNMDMTLTYHLAARLAQQGTQLEPWQISGLTQACRDAKERLLSQDDLQEVSVVVPSRGRSLFANSIKTNLTREEVQQLVVDGFFPESQPGDQPQKPPRSGFSVLNLEYESDPAITRHISQFLTQHQATPSKVLLNGGVFNAESLKATLQNRLSSLLGHSLEMLQPSHLDHAVAKGACHYAVAQAEGGVKVKSGLAANYYIGVESPMPAIPGMTPPVDAICIAPFGMEEGADAHILPNEFALVVGEDVQFRFFRSQQAEPAVVGSVVPSFSLMQLDELQAVHVRLAPEQYQNGELVRVYLSSRVTELGLLLLEAHDTQSEMSWVLEYQVRD